MAGNDEPTKPLPTTDAPNPADQPTEPFVPVDAPGPVDPVAPMVAPHVPVADVHTAELGAAPPPPGRSRSARVLGGILLTALAVAAVVLGLAILGPLLPPGTTPLAPDTATPTPTTATDGSTVAPVDPEPEEPEPAPEEPAPTVAPTTPPEPTVPPTEPPVDPTPEPTP